MISPNSCCGGWNIVLVGLGIMPVNRANQDFGHPQVVRWDGSNLEEVAERLRAAYRRLPGEGLAP